jgi:hypothetical protein
MSWVPFAIGAAGQVGSGIAGAKAQNDATEAALNQLAQTRQDYQNIATPDVAAQQLQLQKLEQQGELNPYLQQAYQQYGSQLNGYQTDPRLQMAQMNALQQMASIGQAGGMDAQAQSALMQAQMQNANAARGAREANLQNAAQRGVSGSGLEFALNQMADQGAAQGNQMAGTQAAGQAAQRALEALQGSGTMAGQMSGQQFGQAATQSQQQNDINRFNTQALQNVSGSNTQALNQAQSANLGEKQRIADQNALLANSQQEYNKQLLQQQFQNQLAKTQGMNSQAANIANVGTQGGANLAKQIGSIGQAAGGVAGAYYGQPQTAKYNTQTGDSLYDPYTGKKYSS